MNCLEARRLLSLRLDNALETTQPDQLEEHLQSCRSCTRFGLQLERLPSLLSADRPTALPVDIVDRVIRSLLASPSTTVSRQDRESTAIRAARAALVAAVSLVTATLATEIGVSTLDSIGSDLARLSELVLDGVEVGRAAQQLMGLVPDVLPLVGQGILATIANAALIAAAAVAAYAYAIRKPQPS